MPDQQKYILSTRPVNAEKAREAKRKGWVLDELSFIETEAIQTIEIQQEVEWASVQLATVVFTSMNAVLAVTDMLEGHVPEWRIYCMGYTTKELISQYFGEQAVAGTADNAAELAELIAEEEEPDEVIFFCGNQRRDELPGKLHKNGFTVTEIVVYETHPIHHELNKVYDGVLFFSPSAVESFFKKNTVPEKTILFAIGKTTAEMIRKFSKNKIVISKQPGKDEMVNQALNYFEDAL